MAPDGTDKPERWSRGWHRRPNDPPGVQRWHNGTQWTNRFTGGTPAAIAAAQRLPEAGQPPQPVAHVPSPPSSGAPVERGSQPLTLRSNCGWSHASIAPFGALLSANHRTNNASLQLFEGDDDDEWLAVSKSGWPVVLKDSGETGLSEWRVITSPTDPVKIAGSWLDRDGGLQQGLRAKGVRCDLVLTERALRVSLAPVNGSGPWVFDDARQAMVSYPSRAAIFGAVFPYAEIRELKGGKHFLEVTFQGCGLGMVGPIYRDKQGSSRRVEMSTFNIELMNAIVRHGRVNAQFAKTTRVGLMAGSDYMDGLRRRFGATYSFSH